MKNINTKKKCVKSPYAPGQIQTLQKAIANAVPVPMSVNDLLDEAIAECADKISREQELLDGLKALKVTFKNVKAGSKEEKALLTLLAGF